jgi:hypothetical protein
MDEDMKLNKFLFAFFGSCSTPLPKRFSSDNLILEKEEIKTKLVRLAMPFIFLIALSPLGISEDTTLHEKVGSYNVSFTVPGERNFNREISDPSSFSGEGDFTGMNGMGCSLKATDEDNGEYLWVIIQKYDTPVAQAATKIFTDSRTPDWIEDNPIHGMIPIYYSIISGYSSHAAIDEYTKMHLVSDMSQSATRKIVQTLYIEEISDNQTEADILQAREKKTLDSAPIQTQTTTPSGRYPANKDTMVYHEPGCTWAGKIKPENLIGFNSPQEAETAGYRHCEKCW